MRGTSLKLSCLVVVLLAVFASFLLPYTAEARHKHIHHHHRRRPPVSPPQPPTPAPIPVADVGVPPYQTHGCGYSCSDSNDCDWPCTICCANQTCCYDEPFFPPIQPLAPSPSIEAPTTAPTAEPYQNHGCGYPCFDSDDCGWPCTACGANYTCSYDEPFIPYEPSPAPSPSIEAPTSPPNDGIEIPPYVIHGCGYPCSDSNDCDWPCTVCCANQTCCREESVSIFPMPPSTSSPPAPILLPLAPSQSVEAPASAPHNDGAAVPQYPVPGGCGWQCSDSNDCNWPCTECGPDHTCCYEQTWPPMF